MIPSINGNYVKTGEVLRVELPLYTKEDCSYADLFQIKKGTEEKGIFLSFLQDDALPDEGYRLLIAPEKIELSYSGSAGMYYGLLTLFTLIREGKGQLACGTLEDYPKYNFRGFMLDVCRHFFTVDQVKHVIDLCAELKFNYFHWHLSDDQGFRIESKRFPLLNQVGSYYTADDGEVVGGYYKQEEIRDIIEYAARRNIEIIPEIDLPGHSTAIIASYPEYSCSGESLPVANIPGIHPRILCAGKEETMEFLSALLEEMADLFPGKYFHIGGDEAPKSEWQKCPDCQKMIQELGLKDEEELQGYFTQQLGICLKKLGKEMIGWNEVLKSGKVDDVIAQYYIEGEETSYAYEEMKKGQRFIFSNEYALYLDYYCILVPLKASYDYVPDLRDHKEIPKNQVLGLETCLWTETIGTMKEIEEMIFPRMLAIAENAWSEKKDYEEFKARVSEYEQYFDERGISYVPVEEADYKGADIVEQVADAMGKRLFFLGRGVPEFVVNAFHQAIMQKVNNMKVFGISEEECERAGRLVAEYLMGTE